MHAVEFSRSRGRGTRTKTPSPLCRYALLLSCNIIATSYEYQVPGVGSYWFSFVIFSSYDKVYECLRLKLTLPSGEIPLFLPPLPGFPGRPRGSVYLDEKGGLKEIPWRSHMARQTKKKRHESFQNTTYVRRVFFKFDMGKV